MPPPPGFTPCQVYISALTKSHPELLAVASGLHSPKVCNQPIVPMRAFWVLLLPAARLLRAYHHTSSHPLPRPLPHILSFKIFLLSYHPECVELQWNHDGSLTQSPYRPTRLLTTMTTFTYWKGIADAVTGVILLTKPEIIYHSVVAKFMSRVSGLRLPNPYPTAEGEISSQHAVAIMVRLSRRLFLYC